MVGRSEIDTATQLVHVHITGQLKVTKHYITPGKRKVLITLLTLI